MSRPGFVVCRGGIYPSPTNPPSTPKRGPLFGRSRFGWYRKIIRKWLFFPALHDLAGFVDAGLEELDPLCDVYGVVAQPLKVLIDHK